MNGRSVGQLGHKDISRSLKVTHLEADKEKAKPPHASYLWPTITGRCWPGAQHVFPGALCVREASSRGPPCALLIWKLFVRVSAAEDGARWDSPAEGQTENRQSGGEGGAKANKSVMDCTKIECFNWEEVGEKKWNNEEEERHVIKMPEVEMDSTPPHLTPNTHTVAGTTRQVLPSHLSS